MLLRTSSQPVVTISPAKCLFKALLSGFSYRKGIWKEVGEMCLICHFWLGNTLVDFVLYLGQNLNCVSCLKNIQDVVFLTK